MGDCVPWVLFLLCVVISIGEARWEKGSPDEGEGKLHSLEGKVELLAANDTSWISHTRVLVDGGQYQGFIRTDGQFTVHGLPNGAYVVEVTHPLYEFTPARVYIFRDGRIRASKLDLIKPNHVRQIKYPLLFRSVRKSRFFQERSSLKLEDLLYNPMVLTVLLPLMLLLIFPKLLSQSLLDPKVQDQFKRQLSTMTGGRGGMIGMGVGETPGEESSEEEATQENGEAKNKKNAKSKKREVQGTQGPPSFNFDLAEWLTEYFYEEKTPKHSDSGTQQMRITPKNQGRKRRHRKQKN